MPTCEIAWAMNFSVFCASREKASSGWRQGAGRLQNKDATQSKVTLFLGHDEEARELKRKLDEMHHEFNRVASYETLSSSFWSTSGNIIVSWELLAITYFMIYRSPTDIKTTSTDALVKHEIWMFWPLWTGLLAYCCCIIFCELILLGWMGATWYLS